MNKILLPNGLNVSEVALGAMMFGTTVSKEEAYRTLDVFMDCLASLKRATDAGKRDLNDILREKRNKNKKQQ